MASRLYKRATVERYRAHPSDLSGLLEESGVVRAGASVASLYSIDVSGSGEVGLYVSEKHCQGSAASICSKQAHSQT